LNANFSGITSQDAHLLVIALYDFNSYDVGQSLSGVKLPLDEFCLERIEYHSWVFERRGPIQYKIGYFQLKIKALQAPKPRLGASNGPTLPLVTPIL